MFNNFKLLSNFLLIYTTYQTNQYQIQLLVFSGITAEGKNTLFGLALANDETIETYKWALDRFIECHENKLPDIFVTDGDLAQFRAISDTKVCQIICQWHLLRGFPCHFGFLV